MPTNSGLWIPPLSPRNQKKANRRQKYQGLVKWTGFPDKALWDWLQLLAALAIPVVIAAGTLWFSAQQSEASLQVSNRQHQTDIQIAQDQQQENALQTYLDRMSDLLLNNKLHESQEGDEVRNVAQARTLTVLPQLDGTRKGELIHFLQRAGLIDRSYPIISLLAANLKGANLTDADLSDANLNRVDLSDANLNRAVLIGADLSDTNLYLADLSDTDLYLADLSDTNLNGANLSGALLSGADLRDAHLIGADLRGADLSNVDPFANNGAIEARLVSADLSNADLSNADLSNANLSNANLSNAKVTQGQLALARSLQDTIMPDGSKHP
jgi:uncharacterized protein YjbI with pentapeptide repeats